MPRRRLAALGLAGALCGSPGCTWDWDQFGRAAADAAAPTVDAPPLDGSDPDVAPPPAPLGATGPWDLDLDETCNRTELNRQLWRTQYIRSQQPFSFFSWAGSWAAEENVILQGGFCRIRVEERVSPKDETKVIATGVMTSQLFYRPPAFFEIRMRGLRGVGMSTVAQLSSSVGYPPQLDLARVEGKDPTGAEQLFFYLTPSETVGSFKITFPEPRADLSADFHVYGLEWRTNKIVVYRDGVRSSMEVPASIAERTFQRGPLQVEITVHTGPGSANPDRPVPPAVPAEVLIDYVRVWKGR